MYLFFDTETTGLPKNYRAPLDDFDNWPRIVQLAWSLYDFHGNHWESFDYLVKPDGFIIPEDVVKVHGISQEKALTEGRDLKDVIKEFLDDVERATYLVAHNIDFDEKIIGSELLRLKMNNPINVANKICTMKRSADVCKIPDGRGGYRWPNLSTLHKFLFAKDFSGAHDAAADVKACADCFFELKRKSLI